MSFVAAGLALFGGPPPPDHAPAEAERLADEILSRPEYGDPPQSMIDRANEWISEQIGRFFEALAGGGGGAVAAWVIFGLFAALVVFLVYRLSRTVQTTPRVEVAAPAPSTRSVRDWLADAEQFEAERHWKEALRCRYRALVTDLVDRNLLPDVPGRTAGEYRSDVAASLPASSEDFARATGLFEDAWYGDLPTGPEENGRFRELASGIRAGAGR